MSEILEESNTMKYTAFCCSASAEVYVITRHVSIMQDFETRITHSETWSIFEESDKKSKDLLQNCYRSSIVIERAKSELSSTTFKPFTTFSDHDANGPRKKSPSVAKKNKTPKSVSLYRIPMDILRVTKVTTSKIETGSRRSAELGKEYNPQNSRHSNHTTLPSFDKVLRTLKTLFLRLLCIKKTNE